MSNENLSPFKNLKKDIPASIVVFLVAIPLCLGIALASGAPPISGLIAGIIGGLVVGSVSGSPLGVSGPAAGLAVIVFDAIEDFGGIETGFEIFLVAVVIAGAIQLLMGFLRAGAIAQYFPGSVIQGMLAGIGILIFLKQIPHAFGYDKDPEGDMEFVQAADGENTFSELINMLDYVNPGVMIITGVSLAILLLWQTKLVSGNKILSLVPGPLLAVVSGILLNLGFKGSSLEVDSSHLVDIPVVESLSDFSSKLTFPNFEAALSNSSVWMTAAIIAIVASLETLLCVEASDKQDPFKRETPTNRELKAQGIGNMLSGFIGGLPVTQVIVRSSANAQAGGVTKMSAIIHGFWLLVSVLTIPFLLKMIPLGTLAAILFVVGFKLAKPAIFKKMYNLGWIHFVSFIVTIAGIIFTDLLMGIIIGFAVFLILNKGKLKTSDEVSAH